MTYNYGWANSDAVHEKTERIRHRLGLAHRKTNFFSRRPMTRAVEKQRKKRWKRQLHRR